MNPMPRLTDDLPHREPGVCSRCGERGMVLLDGGGSTALPTHYLWREHGDADEPETRFVELCTACADAVIEPHPRLYARMAVNAPAIGAMPLCLGCRHRDGLRCANPLAIPNGGPGMPIDIDPPGTMHVNRGGGGRNYWTKVYFRPARSCGGHGPVASEDEEITTVP